MRGSSLVFVVYGIALIVVPVCIVVWTLTIWALPPWWKRYRPDGTTAEPREIEVSLGPVTVKDYPVKEKDG